MLNISDIYIGNNLKINFYEIITKKFRGKNYCT